MRLILDQTEEFGRAFEHFLIEEIRAYLSYKENLQKALGREFFGSGVTAVHSRKFICAYVPAKR